MVSHKIPSDTKMGLPSPAELDAMSDPDPEITAKLPAFQTMFPKLEADTAEGIVQELRKSFGALPIPTTKDNIEHFKTSFQTRDGHTLRILVWRPKSADNKKLPLIVYYHGGGYCVGRSEQTTELSQELALQHQCVVAAPEYRLAPEHKFPVGMDDTWDALKHIASYHEHLGADARLGFIVGGESAGAGVASMLPLRARDENLQPPLTGAFLSAGSYLDTINIPAPYKKLYRPRTDPVCATSPVLTETVSTAFRTCHAPESNSPRFRSALDSKEFARHPPTYLQTCGNDIARDDGFIYADMLRRRGVRTKLDAYSGGPHCFWMVFRDLEMTRKWWEDTHAGIAWLLQPSRVGGMS